MQSCTFATGSSHLPADAARALKCTLVVSLFFAEPPISTVSAGVHCAAKRHCNSASSCETQYTVHKCRDLNFVLHRRVTKLTSLVTLNLVLHCRVDQLDDWVPSVWLSRWPATLEIASSRPPTKVHHSPWRRTLKFYSSPRSRLWEGCIKFW